MNLGQLGRILGTGVVTGLGTGEEQRRNEILEADRALRLKLHQDTLEETKRQHQEREDAARQRFEQEWGVASPEEMNAYTDLFNEAGITPQGSVRRREIPNLLTVANSILGRTPNVEIDPVSGEIMGQSRRPMNLEIPNTGTPAEFQAPNVQEDPLAGFTAEPSGRRTRAATPNRRSISVQPQIYERMQADREKRAEAKGKEDEKRGKLLDILRARASVQRGASLESTLAEYPSLTAKDIIGYEPAAPTKPRQTPQEIEAESAAREKGKLSVRPANNIDDQIKQERLKALQTANLTKEQKKTVEDIFAAMEKGETVPTAKLNQAASSLEQSATRYEKLAETAEDEQERVQYQTHARELLRQAMTVRRYRAGTSSSTPQRGGTPLQNVTNKFGIRLPGAP
jgi:hypothetical protein